MNKLISDIISELEWVQHFSIIAPYGSRVYGTATEESDYDFIAIDEGSWEKKEFVINNINITRYGINSFKDTLFQNEISALETWFLPVSLCPDIEKLHKWFEGVPFLMNFGTLRSSISQKASNSWVKAKKKLTVKEDFNYWVGKKSLFHAFRILDFGCQIAETGKIFDYSHANNYWERIKAIDSADWQVYYDTFKKEFNELHSKFKKLAPKGK